MGLNSHPTRNTQADVVCVTMRILGTGAANPSVQEGTSEIAAVTYLSATGKYRAKFRTKRELYIGHTFGYMAATPSDLAGYSVVTDTYDKTTDATYYVIDFWIYNGSVALADLAANQYLTINFFFRENSVQG